MLDVDALLLGAIVGVTLFLVVLALVAGIRAFTSRNATYGPGGRPNIGGF